jgi:hypothetical protein
MDISEVVFTSLGPFLYNTLFLLLWIFWMDYHYKDENSRIKNFFRSYLSDDTKFYLFTGAVIIVFLFLLLSYAIKSTDVDDAITSGVEAFLKGKNPYQEDVVLHELPSGPVLGRYHYFPPDLLTYSLFYVLTNGFFLEYLGTYWFFPLHLLFLIPGYWIIQEIVYWPHQKLFPFFLLLVTPFLFTNSMLMWIFFLIGYYFYEEKDRKSLGMTFYVLAASVKYLVGFIIVFYFIRTFKQFLADKLSDFTPKDVFNEFSPYILGGATLTLVCIPFNLVDVIISVFFYQGDPSLRGEVAQSVGPALIELLKFMELYEKIIHISFLSMFILPFYATELFITLPFYWWFKEAKNELKIA